MIVLLMLGLVIGAFLVGCSDRGTNVPTRYDTTGWTYYPRGNPPFVTDSANPSPKLMFQRSNPDGLLPMAVYVPEVCWPPRSTPAPLLVLLAPQEGDQFYYIERGLSKLCNEMITSHEIVPMVVVCIGNDDKLGGYFYGNSYPAGFYDEVLGKELIDVLNFDFPMLINSPSKRAIGGVGQGAYGAFRAAIQHPGMYGAVSAVDGPLDFDGNGSLTGFPSLFSAANAEQPHGFFGATVDTAKTKTISRMFLGGCLAFSPHDTLLDYTGLRFRSNVIINQRYQIADSSTLVSAVFPGRGLSGPILRSENIRFDMHLPFKANGQADTPTWQRWMDNNLDALYAKAGGTPLANVAVWMATSEEANRLTYHNQTVAFAQFLNGKVEGGDPIVYPYKGYVGNPATDGQYTYYLLREMLKFHSEQFKKN